MTDKVREALEAAREWLEGWASAEKQLAKINAALAALDAETPATPADVGEEPVAWRVEAHVVESSRKKRMNLYTERLPFYPGEGVKQLSEPVPLYSATALERVTRERDEAEATLDEVCLSNRQEWQRATSAEAKLAEARKVIERFARLADNYANAGPSDAVFAKGSVFVSDIRAARRWIEETKS